MQHRTLFLVFLLAAGCISAVTAAPTLPCEFYGNVSINGNPAPVGTIITATIGGEERGRLVTSVEGVYGGTEAFDARLIVPAAEGENAAAITFLVNGVAVSQTALYTPGEITRMDLAIEVDEPATIATTVPTKVAATAVSVSSSGSGSSSPAGSPPPTAPTPSSAGSPAPTVTSGGAGTPDLTAPPTVQAAGTTFPRFDTLAPASGATAQQAPLQYAPFLALALLLVVLRRR